MERRLSLGDYGRHLWTRDLAREVRGQVTSVLEGLDRGGVLVVDAKGVEVFDYSFANELFAKTVLSLAKEYPGRFFVVEGLTTYTRENLEKALESLGLMMIERKGGTLQLLGKVHSADQATFAAILQEQEHEKESATATALRDRLGIALTAMNERLSKLVGMGVVRREKVVSTAGREQYQYSVLA